MARPKIKITTSAAEIRRGIEDLVRKRGISSYRKLAQSANYSTASLSLLVRRKLNSFRPAVGARMSVTLGVEPSTFYSIFGISDSIEIERATKLYQQYLSPTTETIELLNQRYPLLAGQLERIYEESTFSTRAQILGGLELLVKMYQKQA